MIFSKSRGRRVATEDFKEFFGNSVILYPLVLDFWTWYVQSQGSRDRSTATDNFSRHFWQHSHFYPLVLDTIFSKSRGIFSMFTFDILQKGCIVGFSKKMQLSRLFIPLSWTWYFQSQRGRDGEFSIHFWQLSHFYPIVLDIFSKSRGIAT